MSPNVLAVRDLEVVFRLPEGVIKAVDGVTFRVPRSKTVALVGESGSGKTVISQAILGILPRSAKVRKGQMLMFDPEKPGSFVDIATLKRDAAPIRQLRGEKVSIVFQEPMTSLSPMHTIGNQVSEAFRLHRGRGAKLAREVTEEMLGLVGFPNPAKAMKTYPFELSGGMRQRAMIAMALVCRPALLVADEPTTALDVTIQAQILKLMNDLQDELGMAILIITHDLGVVANMADEIVVMYHGRIMEKGERQDLFSAPTHPYLQALLRAAPRFDMAPGERLTPIREIKTDKSGALMAARPEWPADAPDADKPILEVRGLCKSYALKNSGFLKARDDDRIKAVDDVSFHIARGECLGLVGESGCGKTTTSKMVMRALAPDAGEILFNDRGRRVSVTDLKGGALFEYRRQVQFMFQDPFSSLNPRMTVLDIIAEPLVIHKVCDREERIERVRELMRLVGLDERFLRRYPHSFSGGQRQRIGIARALALQPELLICDEPVSALDVSIQAQMLNLLQDLKKELGLTYLFVSHNMAVIHYMADRIVVMCQGRLVESATRAALFRKPAHPYTQALLNAVPKADPDDPLDLTALMEGKASIPGAWPSPFTDDGSHRMQMLDLGEGHLVRVAGDVGPDEIAA